MHFLGVDVGGTHCRCEWWPPDSRPGAHSRGVQPAVHGVDAAVEALHEVLANVAPHDAPTAAVCAMAGVGDPSTARSIVDGLRAHGIDFPVAVVADVLAAAAAGLVDGPALMLWSGTGSFAVARDRDGELHRTGGRGHLLGDQGSGFDLVRRAAAAVLLAVDGLGPPTLLADALTGAFGASSPQRLGAVLQRLDSGQIAARLPIVLTTAAAGDAVANEVITAGIDGLSMLANAAVRRAGLEWRELPVALGGGVLAPDGALAALLAERLASFGAAAPRFLEARAAARGAAWLAHEVHHRREPALTWVQRVTI
ncbi:MAG: hypothetical protein JNK78_06500 [Planctomycetes bacterium]|nr:hypothetical protein [Planctomycetota bacterium]